MINISFYLVYPYKSALLQPCRNGHRVSTHFCDDDDDCGDWLDEFNCTRSVCWWMSLLLKQT